MNLQLLSQLQKTLENARFTREQEYVSFLLEWLESIPDVESASYFFVNTENDEIQALWRQLNGEAQLGELQSLQKNAWNSFVEKSSLWIESQKKEPKTPLAPENTKDRCFVALHSNQKKCIGFYLLQSSEEKAFFHWNLEELALFQSLCQRDIGYIQELNLLKNQLTLLEQRESEAPPVLDGFMQLSRSILAETSSYVAICQNNLEKISEDVRSFSSLIEFFWDEIKINLDPKDIKRCEDFSARLKMDEIESDVDLLFSDFQDALLRIRLVYQDLNTLRKGKQDIQSFDLHDLFTSQLSLLFSSHSIRIQKNWTTENTPFFYGDKNQIRKAVLLLLLAILREVVSVSEEPFFSITSIEEKECYSFLLEFSNNEEFESTLEMEGRPFIERVFDEHQASYTIVRQEELTLVTVTFPKLFEEETSSETEVQEGMSFFSLPAFEESVESTSHELASIKRQQENESKSLKLLLISEDSLYLRSLKRVLSMQHDVYTASEKVQALATLDAHQNVDLIVCDLQDQSKMTLAFLEHLDSHSPKIAKKCCFMIGLRLSHEAYEFSRFFKNRSIPRNTTSQELYQFLREQRQMQS